MSTDEGREVLKYVIGCAIPVGTTLQGTSGGVTYQFPGEIGLAPSWLRRSLRDSEQRWVSACLLARVNRFGVPVSISIRGSSSALAVSGSEAQDYTVEEGAFYGNVFTGDEGPQVWNACQGKDQAAGDTGTLALRDCAQPDPAHPGLTLCGFNFAGDCADWAPPRNAFACKKYKKAQQSDGDNDRHQIQGGYYEDCSDSADAHHAKRFDEVITVYLTP